jgi:hypothetical protein
LQDRGTVPALDQVLQQVLDMPQAELAAALAVGFAVAGADRERVRAMIRLALDFWTWQRLKSEGLDDASIVDGLARAVTAQIEPTGSAEPAQRQGEAS